MNLMAIITQIGLIRRCHVFLCCCMLAACEQNQVLLPLNTDTSIDSLDHLQEHVYESEADGSSVKSYRLTGIFHNKRDSNVIDLPCNISDDKTERPKETFNCIIRSALNAWHYKSKNQPFRLTFYFNGGLNETYEAEQTARDSYLPAQHTGTYLIYMIWPTGALETWREGTFNIENGRYNNVHQSTWPLIRGTFSTLGQLLDGIGQSPSTLVSSVRTWSATGYGFGSEAYNMKNDTNLVPQKNETLGANHNLVFDTVHADDIFYNGDSDRNQSRQVGIVSTYAYLGAMAPVRIVTTPLTIGLGSTMWENMKRRAANTIRSVTEFDDISIDEQATLQQFPHGTGAFAKFFQWLENCRDIALKSPVDRLDNLRQKYGLCPLAESNNNLVDSNIIDAFKAMKITLIGHSMGSIVINRLLTSFPSLPYENIVYMSGADSIEHTVNAVGPVLDNPKGDALFFNLMLHPMDEAREDSFHGILLSGSLLFMVDDLFEHPGTIPDRTVGQWRNIRQARHMFTQSQQNRILFRVFSRTAPTCDPNIPVSEAEIHKPNSPTLVANLRCATPEDHGGYNNRDVPFWCPEFWGADQVRFRADIDRGQAWNWCVPHAKVAHTD